MRRYERAAAVTNYISKIRHSTFVTRHYVNILVRNRHLRRVYVQNVSCVKYL